MKLLSLLFTNLILALFVGVAISSCAEVAGFALNPIYPSIGIFASGLAMPNIPGLAMAVQTEDWAKDIQEQLFSGMNEFLRFSVNHDQFINNRTVHVPQAGSIPGATKNRTIIPASVLQRDDTTLDYDLDEYTTDPIVIQDIEEVETSYAKRMSVMGHHINVLMDRIAAEGLFDWGSDLAANQVRTTGTLVDDNLPPSATGDRRRLTVVDFKNIAKTMDDQNVPDDGKRWILLPPAMYYEIFTINDLIKSDIAGKLTLPEGVANTILGFKVIKRTGGVIYDNSGTPLRKAIGSASVGDDNFSGIAWHGDFVATAQSGVKVFDNQAEATLYGDVISSLIRAKTTKLRTDQAGIVTLVQASS